MAKTNGKPKLAAIACQDRAPEVTCPAKVLETGPAAERCLLACNAVHQAEILLLEAIEYMQGPVTEVDALVRNLISRARTLTTSAHTLLVDSEEEAERITEAIDEVRHG